MLGDKIHMSNINEQNMLDKAKPFIIKKHEHSYMHTQDIAICIARALCSTP